MKKLLVRIVLALVFLTLLAGVALFLFLDPIVKTAIGKGATYATGVESEVDHVSVGLTGGSFEMKGLRIANPPGFTAPQFLSLGRANASWDNGTVFSDRIEMKEFVLEDVELDLERTKDGSNWNAILDHLKQVAGPAGAKKPEDPKSSTKSLHVGRIEIRGVKVALTLRDVPVVSGATELTLPTIVIEDFKSDGSTLEIIAQLTRSVVTAILEQSAKSGGGVLPKDVLENIGQGLGGLKQTISEEGKKLLENSGLKDAVDGVGDLFKKKK